MTDISMCRGDGCYVRDECYRFTARPDGMWQAWLSTTPTDDGKACDYYIDNANKRDWRESND